MKLFVILLSGLVFSILAAFGVQAAAVEGKRVALVIGNSKYVNAVALPNPANDAHLIASTLRNAGFDVIEGVDQDIAGMHGLISKFTENPTTRTSRSSSTPATACRSTAGTISYRSMPI